MSDDLISAEKARELLGSGESSYWRDLAETVITLHAELDAARSTLATLRDAVLDMRALLSTCDEGARWRVHVEASAWESLRKFAGGGQ